MKWMVLYLSLFVAFVEALPSRRGSGKPGTANLRAGDILFVNGDTGEVNWNDLANNLITEHQDDPQLEINSASRAKNVILFIGDGMGVSTVAAARIYSMQTSGTTLAFDAMPVTGFSRTYNTDSQVPDSAGTATAFLTGVKTRKSIIGMSQEVTISTCNGTMDYKVDSVLKKSIRSGKWAGIMTTTRITHATPAATFSNAANRDYESDSERDKSLEDNNYGPFNPAQCPDIASQLIEDEDNKKIRVVLGGGRRAFRPNTMEDPEYPEDEEAKGKREDGRDLTQEWVEQKVDSNNVHYVWNETEFNKVNPENTDYLMGLFEPSHMQYDLDRQEDKAGEPSLPEMTEKAIKILQKSDNGFFLLVEGGRIDQGHHATQVVRALRDTVAMSEAVEVAQRLTSVEDTLIVVSADHSHVLTVNGYPYINNNITGLSRDKDGKLEMMLDQKPFTTLSYANGPGFLNHRTNLSSDDAEEISHINDGQISPRLDLSEVEGIGHKEFYYDTAMFAEIETHAGEDVPVYASGPMARMFTGVYEQNYIAHAMMYASCVGDYNKRDGCQTSNSAVAYVISVTTMFVATAIGFFARL